MTGLSGPLAEDDIRRFEPFDAYPRCPQYLTQRDNEILLNLLSTQTREQSLQKANDLLSVSQLRHNSGVGDLDGESLMVSRTRVHILKHKHFIPQILFSGTSYISRKTGADKRTSRFLFVGLRPWLRL